MLARLVERLGGAEDLVDLVRSSDAQRLFPALDGPTALARRILPLVPSGVVLASVDLGFLIESLGVQPDADLNLVREAQEARWWSVLLVATGAGLLAAATLCARLARGWGLLGR